MVGGRLRTSMPSYPSRLGARRLSPNRERQYQHAYLTLEDAMQFSTQQQKKKKKAGGENNERRWSLLFIARKDAEEEENQIIRWVSEDWLVLANFPAFLEASWDPRVRHPPTTTLPWFLRWERFPLTDNLNGWMTKAYYYFFLLF